MATRKLKNPSDHVYQVGQEVCIINTDMTRREYGINSNMQKLLYTTAKIEQVFSNAYVVGGYTWSHVDLADAAPSNLKELIANNKKRERLDNVEPKTPVWLKKAEKFRGEKRGYHSCHYMAYFSGKTKELDDPQEMLTNIGYDYRRIGRSCFGSYPSIFRTYKRNDGGVPDRALYKPNFQNPSFESIKGGWLEETEVKRWLELCQEHKIIPKYVTHEDFWGKRKFVLNIENTGYDMFFFQILNARYCDESPEIIRLTTYFHDVVGFDFLVAYVLAHNYQAWPDEEHAGIPRLHEVKHKKTTNHPEYGENTIVYTYKNPKPRVVMLWALRLWKFINEMKEESIANDPSGFWYIHDNMTLLQSDSSTPNTVTNKSYSKLLKFDPAHCEWREPYDHTEYERLKMRH
jgi:hypothetical protein